MTVVQSIGRLTLASLLAVAINAPIPLFADDTRASMRMVYAALAELLPTSMDEQLFDTERGINRMAAALEVLENSAHALTLHAERDQAEFSALARSFEGNISLLRRSLDYGRYHEFNYLVLDLTHNCVSCHARLPAGSGPDFAAGLVESVKDSLYSDLDRALLEIATRRFDDAMTTLERIIADPDTDPLDLELDGVLFDYLTIGISVSADPDRVAGTLDRLRGRDDLPYYMSRYARSWTGYIDELRTVIGEGGDMAAARSLFDRSLTLSPIPSSQVRVVHDLVASSILRRLLEGENLDASERAEAYYMLGVISIRTMNPRPGVPHTELLLDAAIRGAPGTELARHSYALLEEYHRVSFAGLSMAELPDPVLNLDELRQLAGVPADR